MACLDSDGDGWPNGFELGDPCGNFTVNGSPLWSTDISHPGNASSVPQTRKLPPDYISVCGKNPCQALLEEEEEEAQQRQPSSSSSLRGQH